MKKVIGRIMPRDNNRNTPCEVVSVEETSSSFKGVQANGRAYDALKEYWYYEPYIQEAISGYSTQHYDSYYKLTEEDIAAGEIKVDAYWVAKQWKTGSRDDSGALWHSLKTIARFGDKNSVEREIKALYNQAKALARIYKVDLDE